METCILTIAGSDPSAGAGIQADMKTAASLGCYAASAITCVTSQNTTDFYMSEAVDPELVSSQIASVLADMPVAAIKVGMLGSEHVVAAVARALADARKANPALPIVIDPVLAATTQGKDGVQARQELARALVRDLIPLATLLTPNLPEARLLAEAASMVMRGREVDDERPLAAPPEATEQVMAGWAARILIAAGASSVLVKGGHGLDESTCTDLLFCGQEAEHITVHGNCADNADFSVDLEVPSLDAYVRTPVAYSARRCEGEFHGTGCVLSAAIACGLATGLSLPDAVGLGHAHLQELLGQPLDLGHGSHLIDHFSNPVA